MTDIVERLHGLANANTWRTKAERELWNGLDEAATEIERLRKQLRAVLLHVTDLRADNERLRANEAAAIFSFRETNDIALEEIKRLRAKLAERSLAK